MTIEFCAINKPEDWMEMVAEQFGTSVTDNGFSVPPSVGHTDLYQFRGLRADDDDSPFGGKFKMDSRDVLYQ